MSKSLGFHRVVHTQGVLAAFILGIVAAFLALALLIQRVLRLRAAGLQASRPGSQVWLVYLQRSAQFLVVDADSVSLAGWSGAVHPLKYWHGKQIRGVKVQRVNSGGLLRHVGLSVEVSVHGAHDAVEMLFPRWGGFASSKREATEARTAMLQARSVDRAR